jgi:hypothetical protein
MTLSDILSVLCNEPFSLDVNQAKRLTLFQVKKLYLRPRDKNGQIILEPPCVERADSDTIIRLAAKAIRCPMWRVRERRQAHG